MAAWARLVKISESLAVLKLKLARSCEARTLADALRLTLMSHITG